MSESTQGAIDVGLLQELEQSVGREGYLSLFATLMDQLRQTVARLEAALDGADSPGIERYAHSLVSCSGHIGALRLAEAARVLSKEARALNRSGEGDATSPENLAHAAKRVRALIEVSLAQLTRLERDTRGSVTPS